ncbi:LysR substrate-binding domain-containing protein [Microbacterium sediminicola]|uniref:LysR substrate-binding domain-containing protein n=1 Tax=Microbacterium sediminicola TaxID=415210 RepID=A0ABN2IMF4_9MICO
MIELEQLRRFVTVLDTRSFTVAAAQLRMSQPALSQSIARLERDLDSVLIHRNKQRPGVGVVPTVAGASLHADAVEVLAAAGRLEARARRVSGGGDRVAVVVGFSPGTPRRLVSAALASTPHTSSSSADSSASAQAAPPAVLAPAAVVDVSATQLVWGHEHEALIDGVADLIIHQYPQGSVIAGCETFGLVRVPRVALLPIDHALANKRSVTLDDLDGEPILDPGLEDAPAGYRELWLALPRPVDAPLGPIVGPANRTVEEMYAFVAAHRGMAITSQSVAEEYARQDVVARVIEDLDPLEVGVVVRADDLRPAVRAVVAGLVGAASA